MNTVSKSSQKNLDQKQSAEVSPFKNKPILSNREVEKGQSPKQKKSEVVEAGFKIKSKKFTERIQIIAFGKQGGQTDWNPEGLNAKEILEEKYDNRKKYSFSEPYAFLYTPHTPKTRQGVSLPREVIKISKGWDIAIAATSINQDGTLSAKRCMAYPPLAEKLDAIAARMVETQAYSNKNQARHRIGGDIIRIERGDEIKGVYSQQEWKDLVEFAAVTRADKARAPGCTRYCIDSHTRDYSHSFKERYGEGSNSLY